MWKRRRNSLRFRVPVCSCVCMPPTHCPKCGDSVVTIAATFADYECGTGWDAIGGWEFSVKCSKQKESEHEPDETWMVEG